MSKRLFVKWHASATLPNGHERCMPLQLAIQAAENTQQTQNLCKIGCAGFIIRRVQKHMLFYCLTILVAPTVGIPAAVVVLGPGAPLVAPAALVAPGVGPAGAPTGGACWAAAGLTCQASCRQPGGEAVLRLYRSMIVDSKQSSKGIQLRVQFIYHALAF